MASYVTPDTLKELHRDLSRNYEVHKEKIERIWRSCDQKQRTEVIKAGAADNQTLKNRTDSSLGQLCNQIPEWNIQNLTKPESDLLLCQLSHRATKTLFEQYTSGVHGGPGDGEFIQESMRLQNPCYPQSFANCFTVFPSKGQCAQHLQVPDPTVYQEILASTNEPSAVSPETHYVPSATGQLILDRQSYFIQLLNKAVVDILKAGSASGGEEQKSENALRRTLSLSTLFMGGELKKVPPNEVIACAFERKCAIDDYLDLCLTKPAFLS